MSVAVAEHRRVRERSTVEWWPRSRPAVAARTVVQALMLVPMVRWLCRPLRVEQTVRLRREDGPFVFVANHTSHADTALVLRALPPCIRRRTAPAAAEDYFFRGRIRGAVAALAVGAFPFPRRGSAGLDRAQALLDAGWSVLLFPEGTRSTDGRLGRFKAGVGILTARGASVVPIGISGANDVLPKGGRLPRQAPVAVVFGEPARCPGEGPAEIVAERLQRRVSRLRAAARLLRPTPRRTLLQRARALAISRAGLAVAFCWGVGEALLFPIVPDVAVALLAVAAPSRFLPLALAATTGSFAGGAVGYLLGPTFAGGWLLAHAPLVTDQMREHALEAMTAGGARPLLEQPWTGVPFKVFGLQAASAGVSLVQYLSFALAGRGLRIFAVAAVFGVCARPGHRLAPAAIERLYGTFVVAFLTVFGVGLSRVLASWS